MVVLIAAGEAPLEQMRNVREQIEAVALPPHASAANNLGAQVSQTSLAALTVDVPPPPPGARSSVHAKNQTSLARLSAGLLGLAKTGIKALDRSGVAKR